MNEQRWINAKEQYDAVPVPPELNDRVRQGIRSGRSARRRTRGLRSLGTAAACFALVFACLNLSPAIAHAAADLPVVGGLFEVLTIRNYVDTDGDRTVSVTQPGLSGTAFAQQIKIGRAHV